MKEIVIDGKYMEKNPHDYLKKKLDFPDYYGNNLDALFDCLGDICSETKIIIKNSYLIDPDILNTFKDAQEENLELNITLF